MLHLVIKEIKHRKLNFLMGILAIITSVALFTGFFTMTEASNRETVRLTRDMGFNLRVIPKETNINDFWSTGYSKNTMPQDYVLKFNKFKNFSYAHLTATLQEKIIWRDKEVILTGISNEIEPSGKKKAPMVFSIKDKTVILGYEIAKEFNLQKNDSLDISNRRFKVAYSLSENGSEDDIRIFAPLTAVQNILNKKGQINEIRALNCLCLADGEVDPITTLREQLNEVLPEGRVIMNRTIAVAREKQRLMFQNYFSFILPFVIIIAAIWIGALAWLNVRERKQEIGILRSIGYNSKNIAFLFLGKALLIGILGAIIGYLIGTAFSLSIGPDIFKVTAKSIKPDLIIFLWSIIAAPALASLSTFIPMMAAISQDPAKTLLED